MATSPIYGWPEPDNSSLVKNGAQDIRALGDAIDTTMATMVAKTIIDAKGDLIAGSAADTALRLAVGSNGETLVADSSTSTGLRYQPTMAAGKNGIINGGFDIWQRSTSNASFAVSSSGSYVTADRWNIGSSATVNLASSQQVADTVGTKYALRYGRVSGQTATGIVRASNALETISSATFTTNTSITLSFNAKKGADAPSTLTCYVYWGFGTDQSATQIYSGWTSAGFNSQANTVTTTSQKFSFSTAVPTGATQVAIVFDYTSTGTAGANEWMQIEKVQFELGSVATQFTRAGGTIQGELAACQRYYYRTGGDGANGIFGSGISENTTNAYVQVQMPTTMRIAPTAVDYSTLRLTDRIGINSPITSLTFNASDTTKIIAAMYVGASGAGLTANRPIFMTAANSTSAYIGFTAEL
jgi:hypothetical protein